MALSDFYSNFQFLIRWIHVLFAVIWLGHLYFFNFVNVPFQAVLTDADKKIVNPKLMPRALWWFRWSAMITLIAGLVLFTMIYMYSPSQGFGPSDFFYNADRTLSSRAVWIMMGMTLGLIMWFNVWGIIWPAQKAILGGKVPVDRLPGLRRRAHLASRLNAFLSGPMLFGMIGPSHYGSINPVTALIAVALGLIAIGHLLKASSKVGTSI